MVKTINKNLTPKVILVKGNEDLEKIISFLKLGQEVIVNVSLISLKDMYRIIYFISGFVFSYGGKKTKIEEKIYMFKLW